MATNNGTFSSGISGAVQSILDAHDGDATAALNSIFANEASVEFFGLGENGLVKTVCGRGDIHILENGFTVICGHPESRAAAPQVAILPTMSIGCMELETMTETVNAQWHEWKEARAAAKDAETADADADETPAPKAKRKAKAEKTATPKRRKKKTPQALEDAKDALVAKIEKSVQAEYGLDDDDMTAVRELVKDGKLDATDESVVVGVVEDIFDFE